MRAHRLSSVLGLYLYLAAVYPGPGDTLAQVPAYSFHHLSLDEGLSQSTVTAILQDRKGFLWVGTRDGLNRYDGEAFTIFRSGPAHAGGLADDLILSLFEDSKARLWIGTARGGLNRYDAHRDTFVPYDTAAGGTAFPRTVHSIQEDREGHIWFGTPDDGLYRYDPERGVLHRYAHDPAVPGSLPDDRLRAVLVDDASRVWVGTAAGLAVLDHDRVRFRPYPVAPVSADNVGVVTALYQDGRGLVWIGTPGGLHALDPASGRVTRYAHDPADPASLGSDYVRAIVEDPQGRLLVGTEAGLSQLDRATGRFVHHRRDPYDDRSLSSDAVLALYFDRQDNLWVGTYYGGVNAHYSRARGFTHVRQDPTGRKLSGRIVRAFLEDSRGHLWVGTEDGGLSVVAPDGSYRHYRHEPGNPASLLGDNVHGVVEDARGNVWIGSFGGGLDYLDRATGRITHYSHDARDARSLGSNDVVALYLDRRQQLWVGTAGGGLNLFDPATHTFTRFTADGRLGSLSDDAVTYVYEDRAGRLWVGTGKGLNRFDPATRTFRVYYHDPADPASLSLDDVTTIREDRHGRLWVGTLGGGLNLFHPETETFTRYTTADGLPNDVVNGMEEDGRGGLWVSTNDGLSCFLPDEGLFVNYTRAEGLQSDQFNVAASLRLRSGEMVFGGINGFNRFHPDSLRRKPFVPPVLLTDFRINNRSVPVGAPDSPLQAHISETRALSLTYDQAAFVTFSFVALSFAPGDEIRYAYRLRGSHDDWIPAGNQRTATYTHLAPGTYTFEVRAATHGDTWRDAWRGATASVRVHVAPPFWLTWYAYLVYTVLIAALLYILQKYSIIEVQRKNTLLLEHVQIEKERELSELKMDFLTNVSHDLRTPLTLILGPVETLVENPTAPGARHLLKTIRRNAHRLLYMVDQLMDLRKLDAGGLRLDARPGDLAAFVRDTAQLFDEAADEKQIRYTCATEPDELPAWFDHDKVEGVLCNLLANAFKFTPPGGHITVRVDTTGRAPDAWAQIRITDSGPGIAPEDQARIFERFYQAPSRDGTRNRGTGIGLALSKEFVELHRGVLRVESTPGRGSTFTVHLPLGNAHLPAGERTEHGHAERREPDRQAGYYLDVAGHDAVDEPAHGDGAAPAPDPSRPRVLVVEDNAEVRHHLCEVLEGTCHVLTARDGKEGVEMARSVHPDLVLSDVMMPEMDGMELCRQLKTHFATSHIPVVLLTARLTDPDQQMQGLETGADDYVVKPFHPGLLRARVHNLIQSRRQLRERFRTELMIQPSEVTVTSVDEQFLTKAIEVIEKHMDDPGFTVEHLIEGLATSRTATFTKFKDLTDLTPGSFIRFVRLKRAAQLLADTDMSVAQVTYAVGYNDLKYFRKCFQQQFGMTPSEYARLPHDAQERLRSGSVLAGGSAADQPTGK